MVRFALTLVPVALLLAACSPVGPMPVPTDSTSPTVVGFDGDRGWRVEASNGYLTASSPVCSDENILTTENPEFFSLYLEAGPGMPDDWKPGDTYQVDNNGILLEFDSGKYSASRFDGDVQAGIGTYWETFGTFEFERDAQGVITGGSGSGATRIMHENGDTEKLDDAMSFTVTVADEPTWCNLPIDQE